MQIRSLNEADLDDLLALYQHLHPRDEPLPRVAAEDQWRAILMDPRLHYFGAELDGHLRASCTLSIIPNFTRGMRPYGLIENVVTHSEYRGRGLGKQVIQHALDTAWAQRCYKVMLLTGRQDIQGFYEKAGFQAGIKQGFVAYPPPD